MTTRSLRTTAARCTLAAALATACLIGTGSAATAAPDAATVVSVEQVNDRQQLVSVFSPAMNRPIQLQVIRAADGSRPHPTLYLLNGSQGGPGGSGWDVQTDAVGFLRDKNVNVVTPFGGASSYYTDWIRDDAALGRNKWQTFLNEELPPVIEEFLGADGNRALAGVSMSGTSVLNLAIAKPGFWKSVASYSGCAQTSDPIGQEFVRITVENWGGAHRVLTAQSEISASFRWVESDRKDNPRQILEQEGIRFSSGRAASAQRLSIQALTALRETADDGLE